MFPIVSNISDRALCENSLGNIQLLRKTLRGDRRGNKRVYENQGGTRGYKLFRYVNVIWKNDVQDNVQDWNKFLFTNLSNIFSQDHLRVTAAQPLKQVYHLLISGIWEVNKIHLTLVMDLRKWIKKELSHCELVRPLLVS